MNVPKAIQTAINLLDRIIAGLWQGNKPTFDDVGRINSLLPGRGFAKVSFCGTVAELTLDERIMFASNGSVATFSPERGWHDITYDWHPDATDMIFDFVEKHGMKLRADVEEVVEEVFPFVEMPAAVEAMIADVAPVFEQDGLPGVFVKSRTPEAKRQPGEHLHAYQVLGGERVRKCNCPAARRGRKCWHTEAVDLAGVWEQVTRDLYSVLATRGSARPDQIGAFIVASWASAFMRTPKTLRGLHDVPEAMRTYIGDAAGFIARKTKCEMY